MRNFIGLTQKWAHSCTILVHGRNGLQVRMRTEVRVEQAPGFGRLWYGEPNASSKANQTRRKHGSATQPIETRSRRSDRQSRLNHLAHGVMLMARPAWQ